MKIRLLSILCLVAFTAACGPTPTMRIPGLFVKEDFKGKQLRQGGIMVGGVVAEPGKFDLQESDELGTVMFNVLRRGLRNFPVHPTTKLRGALEDERYLEVMSQFATADLAEDTLATIAAALPDVRYLALARIEENRDGGIRQWKGERETKSRLLGPVKVTPIYVSHRRKMAVTMTIYDLESRTTAFSGRFDDKIAVTLTFKEHDPVTVLASIAYDTVQPATYAPPMPTTQEALEHCIGRFVINLPPCGWLYCPG